MGGASLHPCGGFFGVQISNQNMDKKKIIKFVLIGLVVLLFVASIPGVFLNGKELSRAEDNAREVLNEASKICSSNCTDYPTEWGWIKGREKEAELYCMRQCSNNMAGFRQELINDLKPTIFKNQYSYRVGQAYCILGLRCVSLEIEDFILGYKP